jgi:DNA-binding PadR family transcriptional regulator
MRHLQIPALGYALLGLLQQKPASGYDLRKIFSSTSLGSYSDSPGAIYPALSRLEKQALIRGVIEEGKGLRRRQVFRLTPKGFTELKKWIVSPVTRDDLIWRLQQVLLRFAFSEQAVGPAASIQLLKSLQVALKEHLLGLQKELAIMKPVAPISGRLAFESGIRQYECLLEWARYSISTFEKEKKGGLL